VFFGGSGDDHFSGGFNKDEFVGGSGNDVLDGNRQRDRADGGDDMDVCLVEIRRDCE
jgi:hypothetical protein